MGQAALRERAAVKGYRAGSVHALTADEQRLQTGTFNLEGSGRVQEGDLAKIADTANVRVDDKILQAVVNEPATEAANLARRGFAQEQSLAAREARSAAAEGVEEGLGAAGRTLTEGLEIAKGDARATRAAATRVLDDLTDNVIPALRTKRGSYVERIGYIEEAVDTSRRTIRALDDFLNSPTQMSKGIRTEMEKLQARATMLKKRLTRDMQVMTGGEKEAALEYLRYAHQGERQAKEALTRMTRIVQRKHGIPGLQDDLARAKAQLASQLAEDPLSGRAPNALTRRSQKAVNEIQAELTAALKRVDKDPLMREYKTGLLGGRGKDLRRVSDPDDLGLPNTPWEEATALDDFRATRQGRELYERALAKDATPADTRALRLALEESVIDPGAPVTAARRYGRAQDAEMDAIKRAKADLPDLEATRQEMGAIVSDPKARLAATRRGQQELIGKQAPVREEATKLGAVGEPRTVARSSAALASKLRPCRGRRGRPTSSRSPRWTSSSPRA